MKLRDGTRLGKNELVRAKLKTRDPCYSLGHLSGTSIVRVEIERTAITLIGIGI